MPLDHDACLAIMTASTPIEMKRLLVEFEGPQTIPQDQMETVETPVQVEVAEADIKLTPAPGPRAKVPRPAGGKLDWVLWLADQTDKPANQALGKKMWHELNTVGTEEEKAAGRVVQDKYKAVSRGLPMVPVIVD